MKLIEVLHTNIANRMDSILITESIKLLDNILRSSAPAKLSRWTTLFKSPTTPQIVETFVEKYGRGPIDNLTKVTKNQNLTDELLTKVYKQENLTPIEKSMFVEGMAHAVLDNAPIWKHLYDAYTGSKLATLMRDMTPIERVKLKDASDSFKHFSDDFLDATFDWGIARGRKFKYRTDITFTQKMVDDMEDYLTKNSRFRSGAFHYFGVDVPKGSKGYSGWKFHLFGATIADSVDLLTRLKPLTRKWKAEAKVGGKGFQGQFGEKFFKENNKQFGKMGATFYIPPYVFKQGKLQSLLGDIKAALDGYVPAGPIRGDKHLDGAINYRYELNGPIDIENGIIYGDISTPGTYKYMYSGNVGGAYKPTNVQDIF